MASWPHLSGNSYYTLILHSTLLSGSYTLLFVSLGYQIAPSVNEPLSVREEKKEGFTHDLHLPPLLAAAPLIVKSKLGGMSSRQLIQTATSLVRLGMQSPETDFVIQWMEECHSKLYTFTPLQMVQLLKILSEWKVAPGSLWLSDLIKASSKQMHAFSRSRLVEFLDELSCPSLGFTPNESWIQLVLKCFISRNFKEPLPHHLVSLAHSMAAISPSGDSGWSQKTRALLKRALPAATVKDAIASSCKGAEASRMIEVIERLGLKD